MRYGVSYKGSKNKIAEWVVENLPSGEILVDLFAGGCAITHCALLEGKYKHIIANDLQNAHQLFFDAIHGKFKNEKRWISRDDFFALKDNEPYIRWCWSFCNNGDTYLYGRHIEPYKKALHYARVFDDVSLMHGMGIVLPDYNRKTILQNFDYMKEKYIKWYGENLNFCEGSLERLQRLQSLERLQRLQSLERLQRLQRLERLQRLQSLESLQSLQSLGSLQSLQSLERLQRLQRLERLQITQNDYRELAIPQGAVVYCDIPYKTEYSVKSSDYGVQFDWEEFYKWARVQKELVLISGYSMPDDFICVAEKQKRILTNVANIKTKYKTEKLFVHKSKLSEYKQRMGVLF